MKMGRLLMTRDDEASSLPTRTISDDKLVASIPFARAERLEGEKQERELIMKGMLIILSCIALAGSAFGQARTDSNTVAGAPKDVETNMTGHHGVGTVDGFNPDQKYITVVTSSQTRPVKYVLGATMRIENQSGAAVNPKDIRAGTKVSLEFDANNQVDRIIVVDQTGAK